MKVLSRKTPAAKKKLENDLKADYMEICLLIAENCVTLNQWIKIYVSTVGVR